QRSLVRGVGERAVDGGPCPQSAVQAQDLGFRLSAPLAHAQGLHPERQVVGCFQQQLPFLFFERIRLRSGDGQRAEQHALHPKRQRQQRRIAAAASEVAPDLRKRVLQDVV